MSNPPLTPTPPDSPTVIYPITNATVVGQDPDTQTLYVMLRDGQGLGPIQIIFPGACDALRLNQNPMPGKGTTGVVAFVNNDIKSGVWLGSFPPGLYDAIPNGLNEPFTKYESHWSGAWSAQDDSGNTTSVYPDGTSVVVGTEYTPYKHVRDASSGQRTRVPMTASDRPPVASPFQMKITHASGATITISPSGVVTVTSPSLVEVQSPVVSLNNGGTTQYLVTQTAWEYLTGHTHSGVSAGPANTGPPVSVPTSGVLTTVTVSQ